MRFFICDLQEKKEAWVSGRQKRKHRSDAICPLVNRYWNGRRLFRPIIKTNAYKSLALIHRKMPKRTSDDYGQRECKPKSTLLLRPRQSAYARWTHHVVFCRKLRDRRGRNGRQNQLDRKGTDFAAL
jgi:hypothetical protein